MRFFLLFITLLFTFASFSQSWQPTNGSKDGRAHYTAIINATIFVKAGENLQNASLLIKEDKIVAVGTEIEFPSNTVIVDAKGKFVYPSFIDLYTQVGISPLKKEQIKGTVPPQRESKRGEAYYWNENIKPEIKAVELFQYKQKEIEQYRNMGFGVVLTHQNDGIIRGTSVALTLNDKKDISFLKAEAAMHYSLIKGSSRQFYPNSLMGRIALLRQALYDAKWYSNNTDKEKYNRSLEAYNNAKHLPKIIATESTLSMLRADKIGDEFEFKYILKGNGREYERIEEIKQSGAAIITSLNYPKAYAINDLYDAQKLSLSQLKAWELAPENMVFLQDYQISFSITADKIKSKKELFEKVDAAVKRGLRRSKAIEALTQTPASLIGIDSLVGTLEKGKLANFIITSDSLFTSKCKLHSNWILGKEFRIEKEEVIDFSGSYSLNINKDLQFDVSLKKKGNKWIAKVSRKNKNEYKTASFSHDYQRLSLTFKIDDTFHRLSGSVNDTKSRIWSGMSLLNGRWVNWAAIKKIEEKVKDNTEKGDSVISDTSRIIRSKITYPNKAYGWDSLPKNPQTILFRNATVWTNEEDGILKNHDVLIHGGKIQMVGYKINKEVMFPELLDSIVELDLKGKHLTSGIIDEHSHIAISKGVNESGQAISAEVRIGDVINSDDVNIYRQLSGGVTAAQLLHGSSNPIGGQSALIKLRWGQAPEKMKIVGADGFIKFALGENVKQSNWGDQNRSRFPQTRMGVEQVFYEAFIRAMEYKAEWELYNAKKPKEKKKTSPPRVDLELEALAEILDTQRFITCHSYVQSEVNMLMHVADSMGFKINTFTHILEGYKIADKLREHGAGASTFSDWWAYKFEVNDAIPYNGAILQEQGVLTAFNSDDAEMGRRLNQEAAKAVKYGGISEVEAWKFVTLNPAKMLHLDDRMGSIKAGKDADLVIWSDNPLSIYAKVEQTYIDGIDYFNQKRDQDLRRQLKEERERIIAKMLMAKKEGKPTQVVKEKKQLLYECETIEEE